MNAHETLESKFNSIPSSISGGYRASVRNKSMVSTPRSSGSDPLISVITVVRNGSFTIKSCIESVLAQTYENIEHIIVDGGSTDGTVDILHHYGEKIALWISEPDEGIYNALNKGILMAEGSRYIFLGCDDILLPTGVEILVKQANANLLISGKIKVVDQNKAINELTYGHSAAVLIDIRAHDLIGFYDESYRIAADTKFLQLAERALYIHKIEEVVGEFALGGISSNYRQAIQEHARAMYEAGSWSTVRSLLWLAPRLVSAIFRHRAL